MIISTPSPRRWRCRIEDAWKPAVRANLEVSLRLARLVDEFALPDEAESASVYSQPDIRPNDCRP